MSKGSEQGLLGLAFHPKFKTNRKFYVDYTDASGNTVVREYKASASQPGSRSRPARVARSSGSRQPYANHNGGMIAFGRDGYLYIGTGDGGSGGDPGNRAQSKTSLLGKMLRINVNGTTSTHNYRTPASNPYVGPRGPQRDLADRPAQPVALLVRQGQRQPVDRRRGPGPLRGGRSRDPDLERARAGA